MMLYVGHVIFEMSCGYALSGLLPTEQDYRSVQDKRVLDVLQVIFEQDQNRMVAIAAIRKVRRDRDTRECCFGHMSLIIPTTPAT